MPHPLIARIQERAANPSLTTDNGVEFARIGQPLDEEAIRRAEAAFGYELPPLLRDAYRYVGNGGFGPGYGLLPLILPSASADDESAVSLFTAFRTTDPEDPAWSWPSHLLPFCDWGCAIHSCVDCSVSEGRVVTFDPHGHAIGEPMANAFAPTHASLEAWFRDWLDGAKIWDIMFEPDPARTRAGINPFTKAPISIIPNKLRRP